MNKYQATARNLSTWPHENLPNTHTFQNRQRYRTQCEHLGEKRIAIFQVDGEFRAIDDACPHAGASLAEGYVENGHVGCPWHYAEFDLTTGEHCHAPATCGVGVYPVTVEDGQVKVNVA